MGTSVAIVRVSVPPQIGEPGAWLAEPSRRSAVRFAVHLAPFAGVAFLWFIGVLRNRLGALEDQFFATVFFGSGLLFVASLFASAALSGAIVESIASGRINRLNSDTYLLARELIKEFLNVFAIKMAGAFILSTSTIIIRTGILPRWIAILGFACALVLLLVITSWPWIALLFPIWMLVLSIWILFAEFNPFGQRAIT